jgi:hypothetical protein
MTPLAVSVWTLWHGAEMGGDGWLELLADEVRVRLATSDVELVLPFAALDGARLSPGHLTLYAGSGDVIELSGSPDLDEVGKYLKARACALPELTLALRGLGSARAYPGTDHDRFFNPLLAARRAAQRASDPAARLEALQASALAAELERVFHEFAVERFPTNPAERRALETRFEDLASTVRSSLVKLDAAARAVSAAREDTAFVWWRAWAAECRALFAHVDRCWLGAAPLLSRTPVRAARVWWKPWTRQPRDASPVREGAGGHDAPTSSARPPRSAVRSS